MTSPASDSQTDEGRSIEQQVAVERFAGLTRQLSGLQVQVEATAARREAAALVATNAGVPAAELAKVANVTPAAVYKVIRSARKAVEGK